MTSHTFLHSLVSFRILNILGFQILIISSSPHKSSFQAIFQVSLFHPSAHPIQMHELVTMQIPRSFSCQTSPRLGSRKDKAIRIDKCTQSRQIRPLLFEQLAQVLIIKDNITNTLLETPIQVSLPLPLLRYPPKDSPFLTFTFATFTQTPRWHIQTGLPRMTGYGSANSQKLFPIKL